MDAPTELLELGEMLRLARTRVKPRMSQTKLGIALGRYFDEEPYSKDAVGRLERGQVEPTVSEYIAIAEITAASWLLEELRGRGSNSQPTA